MDNHHYYLKQNIIAEPLVNSWYAWSYIISPATAAMVFTHSHVKIMESYIKSPELHKTACKMPENIGGPFIDYPDIRTVEIQHLLNETRQIISKHLEFATDVKKLSVMLENHAKGMSLESLYAELPEQLKGYVELYYDTVNQPHFRLIEALLYQSDFTTDSMQSMLLSTTAEDYRPFCLSTPRLPKPDDIHIVMPFSNDLYNQLFRSREIPLNEKELEQLCEDYAALGTNKEALKKLFTNEKPQSSYEPVKNCGTVRVRYFGHACLLIETQDVNILVDPVLSYQYPTEIARFTYADLPPKIDYVLLTHGHQDHVLLEHLLQLKYKVGTVVVPANGVGALQDPSLKLMLESIGFKSVITLGELEKISLPNGYIQGLPFLGEHGDLHIQTKIAHLIQLYGKRILCAADSNNLDSTLYDHLSRCVGGIDALFIGMECDGAPLSWLYQPVMLTSITRKMDQSRRLNGSDFIKAKHIVDTFRCKEVYIYALGQEPWLNYVMSVNYTVDSAPIVESDKLIEYCRCNNIVAKRLYGKDTFLLEQSYTVEIKASNPSKREMLFL